MRSMGDTEVLFADHGLFLQIHGGDVRPRWAPAAPLDHPIHGVGRALERRLHPSIGKVANVPGEPAPDGLFPAVPTEPDALNVTGHEQSNPLGRHVASVERGKPGTGPAGGRAGGPIPNAVDSRPKPVARATDPTVRCPTASARRRLHL